MADFHLYHWFVVFLVSAMLAVTATVPFWKIFPRAGWPGPVALLMLVPLLNIALLWVLAFKPWPGDEKA